MVTNVAGFGQPGGVVVVAVEQQSGKELWLVQIYQTTYTAEETDVQDVFISHMQSNVDGSALFITHQRAQTALCAGFGQPKSEYA